MKRLLLASRNAHKTREFANLLGPDFVVSDLSTELEAPRVEETGATFAENATLKAVAISKWSGGLVVADDSGLEVDALAGAPGIYSARYSGPDATDQRNIVRLLSQLRDFAGQSVITARFRCVLALGRGGELLETFEGFVEGTIVDPPRGNEGFGYDPVFQPLGTTQTFGELAADEKNRISHRAQAIRLLRKALAE
jgi:XTP/dITP diphosphohydrolase